MTLRIFSARLLGTLLSSTLIVNVAPVVADSLDENKPKNIIMVVADGMGPEYTTAYRYYKDANLEDGITPTIFDKLLVGSASTYPAAESGLVTDSAAGATALSTGVKSYNGAIAVDVQRQPLNTVLREAKRRGMRTGLAVTSQIVHATPASYVSHNESRKNYNEIAEQFFDDRIDGKFIVDVMLGGGTSFFERTDRDLVAEFIDAGYQYTDTYNKLATYPAGANLLGLFAPAGLPWALDDTRKHRLSYLTKQAIKHLENDAGFFLLVEASQVDWAGHVNDVASAMAEMDDLAHTMMYLEEYVTNNPDTLVVLTADHSTGGMSIGANGDYRWEPSWMHGMKASVDNIGRAIATNDDPLALVADQLGFELNDAEKEQVLSLAKLEDNQARANGLKRIIDMRTNTGWTTTGHIAIDVPVFATGPGAFYFVGSQDNTQIAKRLFAMIEGRDIALPKPKPKPKTKSTDAKTTKDEQLCNFKEDWHC